MPTIPLQLDDRPPDTATFSPCGVYRFLLTRELGGSRPLGIIGKNPSIATAVKDDRTITKEVGFAKLWRCGRLVKGNAAAFIATDPDDMKRAEKAGVDVIGPGNDQALRELVEIVRAGDGILLVAWGKGFSLERQRELAEIVGSRAMCLGVNKDGSPEHPLYIPYSRPLVPWWSP